MLFGKVEGAPYELKRLACMLGRYAWRRMCMGWFREAATAAGRKGELREARPGKSV